VCEKFRIIHKEGPCYKKQDTIVGKDAKCIRLKGCHVTTNEETRKVSEFWKRNISVNVDLEEQVEMILNVISGVTEKTMCS
jgi:hypothetical protein